MCVCVFVYVYVCVCVICTYIKQPCPQDILAFEYWTEGKVLSSNIRKVSCPADQVLHTAMLDFLLWLVGQILFDSFSNFPV